MFDQSELSRKSGREKNGMDQTYLSSSGQEINHFLYSSSAMHVQRYIDQVLRHRFAYHIALFVGRIFQELLAQVVTKRIFAE